VAAELNGVRIVVMPHDPALAARMREALRGRAGIVEKKMFGGYCWMQDGHMICGVEVGRFMFRVGAAQESEALALPRASPMDITGRPMKGFVWVAEGHARGASLVAWIERAARHAASLPRREPSARRGTR
jgi:TfoX/Sxy family transcriptional regulator of competence genes